MDAQPIGTLYLCAVSVAELRAGIATVPAGRRRTALKSNIEEKVLPLFAGRILPLDLSCTQAYADIVSETRTAGVAISTADAFITAIAAGVSVINPWAERTNLPRSLKKQRLPVGGVLPFHKLDHALTVHRSTPAQTALVRNPFR